MSLPERIRKKLSAILKAALRFRHLPYYLWFALRPQKILRHEVVYIVEDANWSIQWDGINTVRELRELGRAARTDISPLFHAGKILHFGSSYVFEMQAFQPFTRHNKKVITFFHGQYGEDPALDRRLDLLKDRQDELDGVIVSNSIMRRRFLDMGIPEDKLFLVPIGVDLQVFQPLSVEARRKKRTALGIPEKAFVVGSFQKDGVGWGEGFAPKMIKGPDIFVKTMEALSKADLQNYEGVFCALSGPARGYVKQGLDGAGIPHLHKFYDNANDVAELYQILDAYAVTSREEGGPKAILESLAAGVPLVTTDVGMARDVLDGYDCGYITPREDVEALTAYLYHIAQSPGQAENMRRNGLKRIQDFTWAKVAQACEFVYDTIEQKDHK